MLGNFSFAYGNIHKKGTQKTFFVGRGILDAPLVAQIPSLRRVWEAAPYEHLGILTYQ